MLFKASMTSLLILGYLVASDRLVFFLAWLVVMARTGLVIDLQCLDHVVFVDPIQQSHVGCVYINHPCQDESPPFPLYSLSQDGGLPSPFCYPYPSWCLSLTTIPWVTTK